MNNDSEFDYIEKFPPLGHPEHHFNKYPNHPWLKSKDEIEEWVLLKVKDMDLNGKNEEKVNFIINDDLTVSIKDIEISGLRGRDFSYIPVQFREVNDFLINESLIKSLVGCPYKVNYLSVLDSQKIKDFQGISRVIKNGGDFSGCRIESFYGMGDIKGSNLINIDLSGNLIKSWEFFNNKINIITWWGNVWDEKRDRKLFLEIPLGVERVIFNRSDSISKDIKRNGFSVDMDWLREEQKFIEGKVLLKNGMNNMLDAENKNSKKRKL